MLLSAQRGVLRSTASTIRHPCNSTQTPRTLRYIEDTEVLAGSLRQFSTFVHVARVPRLLGAPVCC